jgi:uncharacterized protein YecT (DUF1311 family)
MLRSALFVVLTATFATPVVAQKPSCARNAFGIFEDLNCALAARDAADRELNATYKRMLSQMSASEAHSLRLAQRAWLQFVKADAQFIVAMEGDGSSGRLLMVNTRERLTRERIAELQTWVTK